MSLATCWYRRPSRLGKPLSFKSGCAAASITMKNGHTWVWVVNIPCGLAGRRMEAGGRGARSRERLSLAPLHLCTPVDISRSQENNTKRTEGQWLCVVAIALLLSLGVQYRDD